MTARGIVATLYLLAVAAFITGVFMRGIADLDLGWDEGEMIGSYVCAAAWMTATVAAVVDVSVRARRQHRTHAADHEV